MIETPNVQHASQPVIKTPLVQHTSILDDVADVVEVSDCWKWPVDALARKFSLLYREVISWRRNLFLLPWGREGADFVQLLADLISRFVNEPAHRPYIWQAVVVAGHVLLQSPFSGSRAAENACTLGARLTIWHSGQLDLLVDECRCIQQHLPAREQRSEGKPFSDTQFARLVYNGKVGAATRYLTKGPSAVLGAQQVVGDRTVLEVLREKHPPATTPTIEVLLNKEPHKPHAVLFQAITPAKIKKVAMRMSGAAGLSGIDSEGWNRMLSVYKGASGSLCSALSRMAVLLCTQEIQPSHLEAFLAGRLIALDKRPGVRPIAIGEVFRRIICRAIAELIEFDVMKAVAPAQLCVGVPSACEIGVHAVRKAFGECPGVEGVLCVDASNAFNSLNRQAALHNIPRVCPVAGQVFANCYSAAISLYMEDDEKILSVEGTCQGDPLAMAFYALATQPLVEALSTVCPSVPQIWYADDDAALGRLVELRCYWDRVLELGQGYGYLPNAKKSTLLVRRELVEEARQLFDGTGVSVTTDGLRYLGSPIGSDEYTGKYARSSEAQWSANVKACADVAESQPHAAYHVFVSALQRQWSYALRVTEFPDGGLSALDEIIDKAFIPALLGHGEGHQARQLLALPVRNGGLGLPVPSSVAPEDFAASQYITECYVRLLLAGVTQSGEFGSSSSIGRSGDSGVVRASGSVVDASSQLPLTSQSFPLVASSVLPSSTGMSDGSAAVVSSGPVVGTSSPLPPPSSSLSSLLSSSSPSASSNPPSDPSSVAMSDGSAFVVPSGSVVDASSLSSPSSPSSLSPPSAPSDPSSPSSLSSPSAPSDPSSSSSPSAPFDPPSNPDERLVQARQECRWRARQHHVARRAAAAASAEMLRPGLSDHQTLLVATASEPGVSSWLTASPSSATSTVLSKRDFRDAIAIRYGFALFDLAERCACGEALTIHHAFVCPAGGYPSARHNELRDLLAAALGEVVSDVELEPRLLPLTDESLPFRTCNRDAEARVDIRARGFWTRQQEAFFDVRVTHPKASLLSRSEVRSQLLSHERAKKRHYASRIIQVDRGAFTPLVFATNGQCAPESGVFLKALVAGIVDKNVDLSYSLVMNHLRCRISFCLLRWAVTCLRGSRSSYRRHHGGGLAAECRRLGLTVN